MTLARLLARTGVLGRHGLDCSLCTPDRQVQRGCGKRPRLGTITNHETLETSGSPDGYGGMVYEWDRLWFLRWCAGTKPPTKPDGEAAGQFYPYADLGHAAYHTGSQWACCPAWYAHKAQDAWTNEVADTAWMVAEDIRRGAGRSLDMGDATPTPQFARLLRTALDVLAAEDQAAEARAIEKVRKNAGGGG